MTEFKKGKHLKVPELSEEERRALDDFAKKNNRSMAGQVKAFVLEGLDKNKKKGET